MSDNSIFVRSAAFSLDDFEIRSDSAGDGLSIAGYVARFGEPTRIVDHVGEYTEELQRGAFARTIAERGASKVRMQLDHGHDALFGGLPVGVWTRFDERAKGLWGEGRILDTWHTIPVRAAIEAGAIDGMSFRFKVIREDWRKATRAGELDHRTIREVALYEAGPVVYPAYEGTTVGIRSAALDLYRQAFAGEASHKRDGSCDTMNVETAVAPVGDTGHLRTEADPPVGITRREMRMRALSLLGASHDPDRGAA